MPCRLGLGPLPGANRWNPQIPVGLGGAEGAEEVGGAPVTSTHLGLQSPVDSGGMSEHTRASRRGARPGDNMSNMQGTEATEGAPGIATSSILTTSY